jgi:Zn-dependent metalloprotease
MSVAGWLNLAREPSEPQFIIPPYILLEAAQRGPSPMRQAAIETLAQSEALRARRTTIAELIALAPDGAESVAALMPPAGPRTAVYDSDHGSERGLPGRLARGDDRPPVGDAAVNQAYDGAERTHAFVAEVFGRDSIDSRGMEIRSSVHFGVDFENAFWNGSQMVYGDGGRIFRSGALTGCLDVIGHELAHGITQYSAGLEYRYESGALNESFSDVVGSLVKQWSLGQRAEDADWLIGAGIWGPSVKGVALRSMVKPGSAYVGDRQPDSMADYVRLPDDGSPGNDHGGVHINSGIPNRAFVLCALGFGSNAWERAGRIWYRAWTTALRPKASFKDAARATVSAGQAEGGRAAAAVVREAWRTVGVLPPAASGGR